MSLSEKLIVAAKKGNVREVRKLLGRGALFTKDQYGNTALHEAAWNGNKDIVKALLGAFCFVDSINHTGFTPLHLASQNGHAKVVKALLKWRADPSLMNQHGETALHLVAKYNHPGVISAFNTFKVPMDIRGKDGNTALHISATLGNTEVTKSLLHNGADPTITNMKGLTPLDLSVTGNYKDCSKLLQSAMSKWKLKAKTLRTSSNKYAESSSMPGPIRRADTYSHSQLSAAGLKAASKKSYLTKTKGTTVQENFFKERRQKNGYFSEDDSLKPQIEGHPRFLNDQEVPNGFPYGASGARGVGGAIREGSDTSEEPDMGRNASPIQSKSASIDQLLTEMEREYYGPGYRYTPQSHPSQDQGKAGLITPYAEIRQLEPPRPTTLMTNTSSSEAQNRPHRSFSQDDAMCYDMLKAPAQRQNYDSLELSSSQPESTHHHHNPHFHPLNNNNISSSYTQVPRSPRHKNRGKNGHQVTMRHNKSPSASPGKSRSVRQSLPHMPSREEVFGAAMDGEDMDTYVYMAPLSDFPEVAEQLNAAGRSRGIEFEAETGSEVSIHLQDGPGSELSSVTGSDSGSKNSKKAVICNSPLEADRKFEPNSGLEPVKGILSQSSGTDADKSQLEQYLQEELETMRQAFQIRLGQLERRYQRQLVMEQKRNLTNAQGGAVSRHKRAAPLSNNSQRRNSWHSYITSDEELDRLALPDEPRSGSSLGVDSDHSVEGSDREDWGEERVRNKSGKRKSVTIVEANNSTADSTLNELPESLRDQSTRPATSGDGPVYSTPKKQKEGLKGGAKSWKEESEQINSPQLSPVSNDLSQDETSVIDDGAKELIQKKMEEYREKMMKYFQEKSEAQICVIEEKYQKQIDEVKKRYNDAASEKLSHLATRIKDLENMLDVQTLV